MQISTELNFRKLPKEIQQKDDDVDDDDDDDDDKGNVEWKCDASDLNTKRSSIRGIQILTERQCRFSTELNFRKLQKQIQQKKTKKTLYEIAMLYI